MVILIGIVTFLCCLPIDLHVNFVFLNFIHDAFYRLDKYLALNYIFIIFYFKVFGKKY